MELCGSKKWQPAPSGVVIGAAPQLLLQLQRHQPLLRFKGLTEDIKRRMMCGQTWAGERAGGRVIIGHFSVFLLT